ncbi:Uncharacterized protein Adt_30414 [Abeliophyllum distichum]|uniref:Uncharacterized protein n=1 Tax=Abeliophyllum distichum TaxID=126358 RepID=A0ABD1RB69_9LAMI
MKLEEDVLKEQVEEDYEIVMPNEVLVSKYDLKQYVLISYPLMLPIYNVHVEVTSHDWRPLLPNRTRRREPREKRFEAKNEKQWHLNCAIKHLIRVVYDVCLEFWDSLALEVFHQPSVIIHLKRLHKIPWSRSFHDDDQGGRATKYGGVVM